MMDINARPKRRLRCAIYTRKSSEEGLDMEFNSLDALAAQFDGRGIATRRIRHDVKPVAGTRLMREYQGVQHSVTVTGDGYEYQGRPYRSLSAIARAITGTRWNGLLFFGLRSRGAA